MRGLIMQWWFRKRILRRLAAGRLETLTDADKHKQGPTDTVKDVTFEEVGRLGEWQICGDCVTPTWTR